MMKEVESGKVGTILIKDMSRMGRDYLKVGQYMELLRQKNVRLIAVNENPYIGNYDCVYTRNEKGRELLLEGRVKALANREERCISHKKVKGALE